MLPQWYLDEGGNHQQRFAAWIANTGKIWLLGNEPGAVPDLAGHGQDALYDHEYVAFFHDYHQFISSRDPTALFATAGLAMTTTPTWREDLTVEAVAAIWGNVLTLYHTTYGIEMPVDIWNMHLYAGDGCQQEDLHRQKFMTAIMAFRDFVDTTRSWSLPGLPTDPDRVQWFLRTHLSAIQPGELLSVPADFVPYLESLGACGVLDKWFWFVSSGGTQWPPSRF